MQFLQLHDSIRKMWIYILTRLALDFIYIINYFFIRIITYREQLIVTHNCSQTEALAKRNR